VLSVTTESVEFITNKWCAFRDTYRNKEFKKLHTVVQEVLTAPPVR
jgi:hypothetical protein